MKRSLAQRYCDHDAVRVGIYHKAPKGLVLATSMAVSEITPVHAILTPYKDKKSTAVLDTCNSTI